MRRIGLEHVMDCYVIWKFSENIDGCQEVPGRLHRQLQAGASWRANSITFPCFAKTVPDLKQLISNDPKAVPHDKYAVLSKTCSIGRPTSAIPAIRTRAIDETFNTWVINTMFAKAATGAETPENASSRPKCQDEGDLGEVERARDDLIRSSRCRISGPGSVPGLRCRQLAVIQTSRLVTCRRTNGN